jgi:hypothetical protein
MRGMADEGAAIPVLNLRDGAYAPQQTVEARIQAQAVEHPLPPAVNRQSVKLESYVTPRAA